MSELATIAIAGTGAMGAAIGARLTRHGLRVLTPRGRSAASVERAAAAGIEIVPPQALSEVDAFFSLVPSDAAVSLAETVAPALAAGGRRPLYVDWNAISLQTLDGVRAVVEGAGLPLVDGGIIGLPPKPDDSPGPRLYASGPEAGRLAGLAERGLDIAVMDAPIGSASALKLSYAGITKGLNALSMAMLLAASRNGCGPALIAELQRSQPMLAKRFHKSMPDSVPKTARWIAEMNDLADYVGQDDDGAGIYRGIAALFEGLWQGDQGEAKRVTLMEMARRLGEE